MSDYGGCTRPTSSSSALTKLARWMAPGGKTTQTVSRYSLCEVFTGCCHGRDALWRSDFIFIPVFSYLFTFMAVHRDILRFSHCWAICVVFRVCEKGLLGKEGIPWCGFVLPVGESAHENWLEERHFASVGETSWTLGEKKTILSFSREKLKICQICDERMSIVKSRCT